MTDVTVCFNALKKVVDEFRSSESLQMAQPSARYGVPPRIRPTLSEVYLALLQ
jgi:hypothetical protein